MRLSEDVANKISSFSMLVYIGHIERSPSARRKSVISMGLREFAALEVDFLDTGAV